MSIQMDKEVLHHSEGASASATEIRRKKLFVCSRENILLQAREDGLPVTFKSIYSKVVLDPKSVQRLDYGGVDFRASTAGGCQKLVTNAERTFLRNKSNRRREARDSF